MGGRRRVLLTATRLSFIPEATIELWTTVSISTGFLSSNAVWAKQPAVVHGRRLTDQQRS